MQHTGTEPRCAAQGKQSMQRMNNHRASPQAALNNTSPALTRAIHTHGGALQTSPPPVSPTECLIAPPRTRVMWATRILVSGARQARSRLLLICMCLNHCTASNADHVGHAHTSEGPGEQGVAAPDIDFNGALFIRQATSFRVPLPCKAPLKSMPGAVN